MQDAQSQTPRQSMEYKTLPIPAHSESPSCPLAIPSAEDHLQMMRLSSMNAPTSRGVKRVPSSSSEDSKRMQSEVNPDLRCQSRESKVNPVVRCQSRADSKKQRLLAIPRM